MPRPAAKLGPMSNFRERRLHVALLAAHFTACDSHWRFRDIRDQFNRLYLVHSGYATVTMRGVEIELLPGQLYLLPLGVQANYECPHAMDLHWVHFRLELYAGIDLFQYARPPVALPAPPDAAAIMETIEAAACETADPVCLAEAVAGLTRLVAPFVPASWDALAPPELDRLKPAFAMVVARSTDTQLSLDDLAGSCGYHPTYFSNLFTAAVGISPMRYMMHHRLGLAKQLISNSDLTMAEVAVRSGFRDAAYFSRVFSRHEGCPPGTWRRRFGRVRP